jgi:hypothetical protein
MMDYAFGALAVTTVTALGDGHIVDADMEINAVDVVWMNLDPGVTVPFPQVASLVFDLQNALTHEFGHFIGLGHTCFDSSMGSSELWPIDDKGNKVPDCNEPDLPIDIKNTVMFPVTNAGDVNKRVLSPDDINAVCQIYAPSIAHEECRLDSVAPACAISPAGPCHPGRDLRSATAAALVCILAIVTRRRRCPSARRQPSTPSSASI